MDVRVDQGGQAGRGPQNRVQVEADLGQEVEIGPEPREAENLVDGVEGASGVVDEDEPGLDLVDPRRTEPGDDRDASGAHEVPDSRTEGSTGRELVRGPTAEGVPDLVSPQHPRDPRIRRRLHETGQGDQRRQGGVSTPDDRRVSARVPCPGRGRRDVRHPVGDAIAKRLLAQRGKPVTTKRAGTSPRPRRVDHRAAQQPLLGSVHRARVHHERLPLPAGVDYPVAPSTRHAGDPCVQAECSRGGPVECRRERDEVGLDPFTPEWMRLGGGRLPSARGEEARGRRRHEVTPHREQADVPPFPYGGAHTRPLFDHERGKSALVELRGGRQARGSPR
ncbi:hypothetical protein J4H86_18275 [Spiractinospora alimapuensis]|nr:hypothetical protein J4H86_18275 [Spiractinospora alimapuensis]